MTDQHPINPSWELQQQWREQAPRYPLSVIDLREKTEEVIRIDKEGFHYRGQFIADAGEAHRLLVEFLKNHTAHYIAPRALEDSNG